MFVIMRLLHCDLAEAQQAFFNAPCRDAERRFHNRAMDLLEEAADHEATARATLDSPINSG
ncbi:hypothetical protein ACH3VS_29220 [Streptomyces sp. WSLK1-3]|uniref:hypothetical protein n=1 Tax=Streptomyces sp. WSLK1-3 TaxID=3375475 RepID=UPI00379F319A